MLFMQTNGNKIFQSVMSYISPYIQKQNDTRPSDKLTESHQNIQLDLPEDSLHIVVLPEGSLYIVVLSIYEKYLPEFVALHPLFSKMIKENPLNFILILSFIVLYSLVYASNMVYNLIGLIYPVIYGLYLFENMKETDTIPIDKLLTLNRYWILFMGIMIMEYFLYGILRFIPLYSMAKIIFILMLVRNDFLLTDNVFDILKLAFKSAFVNIEQHINLYFEKIKSQ